MFMGEKSRSNFALSSNVSQEKYDNIFKKDGGMGCDDLEELSALRATIDRWLKIWNCHLIGEKLPSDGCGLCLYWEARARKLGFYKCDNCVLNRYGYCCVDSHSPYRGYSLVYENKAEHAMDMAMLLILILCSEEDRLKV